ncbi:Clp protease N-terminal domain-containing protein [Streptomyces sp. NPDC058001]|uniref:Clp protease N-terminal domain-containing protein n=1 Tax=Streptomyces sp. NPDC058001 TaxID=3346300 RepID=UPI0036EB80B3
MGQRGTTGVHAEGSDSVVGATTEFETDVINLLVETVRRAVRRELSVVGTDTLLGELVLGESDAGEAFAPGMRKAGSLSGLIAGRAGLGWVSDDEAPGVPQAAERVAGEAGEEAGEREADDAKEVADEAEVESAWREALWRFEALSSRSDRKSGRALPGMTGALRVCLLLALGTARAEGTIAVRCRHVARALLELPDTRAREALVLERLDTAAAARALDAVDAGATAETERPESSGTAVLRRAGTFGKSGNRLTRALASWIAQSQANGSPVVSAVSVEAARQAVRRGRDAAEPVDLLLGTLALDRGLSVAGRSLPESLTDVNAAPELLRRHGVRQVSLAASASKLPPAAAPEGEGGGEGGGEGDGDGGSHEYGPLSAAANRVVSVARLSAAEHGSPTVGTVHLLAALLDERSGAVGRLLAAEQVDVAALRAELDLRLGA